MKWTKEEALEKLYDMVEASKWTLKHPEDRALYLDFIGKSAIFSEVKKYLHEQT